MTSNIAVETIIYVVVLLSVFPHWTQACCPFTKTTKWKKSERQWQQKELATEECKSSTEGTRMINCHEYFAFEWYFHDLCKQQCSHVRIPWIACAVDVCGDLDNTRIHARCGPRCQTTVGTVDQITSKYNRTCLVPRLSATTNPKGLSSALASGFILRDFVPAKTGNDLIETKSTLLNIKLSTRAHIRPQSVTTTTESAFSMNMKTSDFELSLPKNFTNPTTSNTLQIFVTTPGALTKSPVPLRTKLFGLSQNESVSTTINEMKIPTQLISTKSELNSSMLNNRGGPIETTYPNAISAEYESLSEHGNPIESNPKTHFTTDPAVLENWNRVFHDYPMKTNHIRKSSKDEMQVEDKTSRKLPKYDPAEPTQATLHKPGVLNKPEKDIFRSESFTKSPIVNGIGTIMVTAKSNDFSLADNTTDLPEFPTETSEIYSVPTTLPKCALASNFCQKRYRFDMNKSPKTSGEIDDFCRGYSKYFGCTKVVRIYGEDCSNEVRNAFLEQSCSKENRTTYKQFVDCYATIKSKPIQTRTHVATCQKADPNLQNLGVYEHDNVVRYLLKLHRACMKYLITEMCPDASSSAVVDLFYSGASVLSNY